MEDTGYEKSCQLLCPRVVEQTNRNLKNMQNTLLNEKFNPLLIFELCTCIPFSIRKLITVHDFSRGLISIFNIPSERGLGVI